MKGKNPFWIEKLTPIQIAAFDPRSIGAYAANSLRKSGSTSSLRSMGYEPAEFPAPQNALLGRAASHSAERNYNLVELGPARHRQELRRPGGVTLLGAAHRAHDGGKPLRPHERPWRRGMVQIWDVVGFDEVADLQKMPGEVITTHEDLLRVAQLPARGRLTQTLQAAETGGATLAIIDTAGKSDSAATEAARRAHLVFVVSRPHLFDMETLPSVRDILRIAGDPRAFVLFNNLHPQGSHIAEEFKALTMGYCSIPACPVHLCQRAAYSNATGGGKAPQEIDPEGKATAELDRLFSFTKETLTNG